MVGRTEFVKPGADDRDPITAMLFYLALKKPHIVTTFWKQASGHADQRQMLKFLANDFEEQRWRSAALKNAFALMSKQRFCAFPIYQVFEPQLFSADTDLAATLVFFQSLPPPSSFSATASKTPLMSASGNSTMCSWRLYSLVPTKATLVRSCGRCLKKRCCPLRSVMASAGLRPGRYGCSDVVTSRYKRSSCVNVQAARLARSLITEANSHIFDRRRRFLFSPRDCHTDSTPSAVQPGRIRLSSSCLHSCAAGRCRR